jgi:N-acetylmuramoyl-L-alanine amidase
MTVPIKGNESASLIHAKAWARQRNATRLVEVDRYLEEVWRLGGVLGYDPAMVAAQSSEETGAWTSPIWKSRLNPVGLGVTECGDLGIEFKNGIDAARAHLVHLSAYVRGYEPKVKAHLALDPRWQAVFEAGFAGTVKTVDDLSGTWASDPGYAGKIFEHLRGIHQAIATPTLTPQPTHGGASLPPDIQVHATGNWGERTFGQLPVTIVYHITDSMDLEHTLRWYREPASRTSAHAVIARDGTVHQLVSSLKAAWSNNDIKNPRQDIPWLSEAIRQNGLHGGPMSLNDFTLSIEHVGTPNEPPTEAQYRSCIAQSAYWRDRFGIKPGRGRMLRHSDINSVDRSHCPGRQFDLARVITALGGNPARLID